ncbi:MAG: cytochrome c-type biosis protein CcmH [Solirubrobacterales bacterium]|nr:cytochrome c-type biosis protein CcmH [Solirubrobacterales bacterium]
MSGRIAVVAVALTALIAAPAAAETRASLPDIEDEVMCPICGTTLQLSDSPQAERERELIRGLIAKGLTKQQIKDELVAEYGKDVLATPGDSGFDLTAWVVPIAGFAAALAGIGAALWRWRRRARRDPPTPAAAAAEQAERLDNDLAKYDL